MSAPDIERRAKKFFDDFIEAFHTFSGAIIAERYLPPYLAFHSHRSAQVFSSAEKVAAYFQDIVDDYYTRGCRTCRYQDLRVVPLGNECVLGTVTWELMAEDGSRISTWRESYNLCLVDGRFLAFTSTDHVA